MRLDQLIKDVRNTKDIENLSKILPTLGPKIIMLIEMADKADKELTIVHECLTDIYGDETSTRIRKALNKIENL